MPKYQYQAESFPTHLGKNLSGSHTIHCSWEDIVRAAISVGRADWTRVFHHGYYSAFEVVYRACMVYANLCIDESDVWQQSSAYQDLDPSEKTAISYFLGLTMAKLQAEKLLAVPWLMHLDVYTSFLKPAVKSLSRPDLVGIDSAGKWIVIESKGRSGSITKATKKKAKEQAKQLTAINGDKPTLCIGMVTYFTTGSNLRTHMADPPIANELGTSLELGPETFLYDYYRMFADLIESGYASSELLDINNRQYRRTYIREVDLYVSLNERIYNAWVEARNTGRLSRELVLQSLPNVPIPLEQSRDRGTTVLRRAPDAQPGISIGSDGIVVELGASWQRQIASRIPIHPHDGGNIHREQPLQPTITHGSVDINHLFAELEAFLSSPKPDSLHVLDTLIQIAYEVTRNDPDHLQHGETVTLALSHLLRRYSDKGIPAGIQRVIEQIDSLAKQVYELHLRDTLDSKHKLKRELVESLKRIGMHHNPNLIEHAYSYLSLFIRQ